jgi:hypothetical protein
MYTPLQFNFVPYPVWRRKQPNWLRALSQPLLKRHYPVQLDKQHPTFYWELAHYLLHWGFF